MRSSQASGLCTPPARSRSSARSRRLQTRSTSPPARHETADGLRLTFKEHPAVAAELEALVDAENDCCSWAAWTVERDEDRTLVMAARSQGEGIATLHGMFTKEATPWKRSSECC